MIKCTGAHSHDLSNRVFLFVRLQSSFNINSFLFLSLSLSLSSNSVCVATASPSRGSYSETFENGYNEGI